MTPLGFPREGQDPLTGREHPVLPLETQQVTSVAGWGLLGPPQPWLLQGTNRPGTHQTDGPAQPCAWPFPQPPEHQLLVFAPKPINFSPPCLTGFPDVAVSINSNQVSPADWPALASASPKSQPSARWSPGSLPGCRAACSLVTCPLLEEQGTQSPGQQIGTGATLFPEIGHRWTLKEGEAAWKHASLPQLVAPFDLFYEVKCIIQHLPS